MTDKEMTDMMSAMKKDLVDPLAVPYKFLSPSDQKYELVYDFIKRIANLPHLPEHIFKLLEEKKNATNNCTCPSCMARKLLNSRWAEPDHTIQSRMTNLEQRLQELVYHLQQLRQEMANQNKLNVLPVDNWTINQYTTTGWNSNK